MGVTASRIVPAAVLTIGLMTAPIFTPSGHAERSPQENRAIHDSIARVATYYEEHKELRVPPSSGWKHYVRAKRFLDARTINGVLPSAVDRVRAWEIGRARAVAAPPPTEGWFSIGPTNIAGRIVDLKFDPTNPQRVYAASASGGLWSSRNGGDTWRTTTDGLSSLAIGAVCVLPTDPNVVLAATGEGLMWMYVVFGTGIWKSTDAGETWGPTSLSHEITDNHGFYAMEANPFTGTILAGATDGLWRSTDEGDTWNRVLSDGNYFDIKWKPGSASRVYVAKGDSPSGNGVKVSTNDGLTWATAGTGQPPSSSISKTRIAVTQANPSVIYAHYGSSQTGGTLGIYRSTDNGATWSPRNTSLNISGTQGMYAVTIAADPNDPLRVIAGGIELYLSTNGGIDFAETGDGNPLGDETAVHWDHHAIAWEPGSTSRVWVGTDGGAWRSTDDGSTWSPRRNGLVTTQYYDVCLDVQDPGFTMGGSQDNGLTWAEDADTTWSPSTLVADGFACFLEQSSPNTIYSEWQFGGHVKSTDRGQSWFVTQDGIAGYAVPFAPLDLDPNRPGHLYTSSLNGIYRTTNGQTLWVRVSTHQATWVSISPVDGDIVWTTDGNASENPVRLTTDDGATWTTAGAYGFPVGNETKILAHPTDPATAFVLFAGYADVAHVARTTNLGVTWDDVSGDFPPDPANTMVVDPDDPSQWYVGTDTGVWSSENDGVNWMPVGAAFPNVMVHDMELHRQARKLVAITYGRGAMEIDLPSAADAEFPPSFHQADLLLDPPAPNPVSGKVFFRFASRRPGPASLVVVDVHGRLVSHITSLADGDGIIRVAEWTWSRRVSSGAYFVVLRSGSESLSRTLVLVE